ncbi:MAG: nitrogenase component 1 [Elusimicrobiota bacterium]
MTAIDAWRSFLRREEFARHKFTGLVPSRPTVDIMHGDLECRYTFPTPEGDSPGVLNLPWLRANRETKPAPYRILTTDLKERDVVLGGLGKAAECLRLAVKSRGHVVLLNSACVPDLTGEDAARLLAPHKGAPVLYHPSDGKDVAPVILRDLIRLSGLRKTRKAPGSVALIGYPGGRAQRELVALLERARVRVRACVLPDLSARALRRASAAACSVVFSSRILESLCRGLLEEFKLPVVRPPSPYGLEGTKKWLDSVASSVGRDGSAAWRSAALRILPEWAEMTRQARDYRLGFILDPSELPRLSEPAWNAGIPLVEAVKEMGFGIDYFVYAEQEQGRFGRGERHRLHAFRSEGELDTLIRGGGCHAFYSDCYRDRRLTRRGKAQFSLDAFEPGPQGALRTLRRLLDVCRLPFYPRYGGYLAEG